MKSYIIPTTEATDLALATILCASEPDLGKEGNTSDFGGGTMYGD